MTAKAFIDALKAIADPGNVPEVSRWFHGRTKVLGVSIGQIFPVAKRFSAMPLDQVERLLDSAFYEARMGAVAIMDFQARAKRITPAERKALFDLYLNKHDRIDNWDLVDRAAPWVVGGYLADQPRDTLDRLARSKNPWERRTAIVATWFFIRAGDIDDTFRIAEILVADEHELVQKAVGSWIREAGKRDPKRLIAFLDRHAARMPRVMLRYAVEKLAPADRRRYLQRE